MTRANRIQAVRAFVTGILFCALQTIAIGDSYDPLAVSDRAGSKPIDMTVHDADRNRDIPIRVYMPQEEKAATVMLFSHGLGGSRKGSAYLGKHWAARGYVAVFLQHPGSDAAVWQNTTRGKRFAELKKAANFKNYKLRVQDIPAVLDQLEEWNDSSDHELAGRMDLSRVGMSGHSFGAVTTQAVSGQISPKFIGTFTEPRIKAAIPMSQSVPRFGNANNAFGKVQIPWLLMTGTKDTSMIGHADVANRLKVYPALPPGGKYELVLYNAEHSAFTERPLPGDQEKRNPNHHRVILALSTAFWDAYLRDNEAAKAWLDGNGAKSVLEEKDRWQHK